MQENTGAAEVLRMHKLRGGGPATMKRSLLRRLDVRLFAVMAAVRGTIVQFSSRR